MDSSRTDYSHYRKNSSDLGSEGPEKQPSETHAEKNSPTSSLCTDELDARIEAAPRDDKALVDKLPGSRSHRPNNPAPSDDSDIGALPAALDIEALAGTETAQEVIEKMTVADLDWNDPLGDGPADQPDNPVNADAQTDGSVKEPEHLPERQTLGLALDNPVSSKLHFSIPRCRIHALSQGLVR